jgi:glutamate 5-kinase
MDRSNNFSRVTGASTLQQELYVVKIGSSCLFAGDNGIKRIDDTRIRQKGLEIKELEAEGCKFILVVSGAIALAKHRAGDARDNKDISVLELQSYAKEGQPMLINMYDNAFGHRRMGQQLLDRHHLRRSGNLGALLRLDIERGILTYVNYNDGSDGSQVRKDNDTVGSFTARISGAGTLILLGLGYHGFYGADGKVILRMTEVNAYHYGLCGNGKSTDGTGGMRTKLDAARETLAFGGQTIIGSIDDPLRGLIEGSVIRTLIRS